MEAFVIIGCPGCAEVQWPTISETKSDIECPPSVTSRSLVERYPLVIAG